MYNLHVYQLRLFQAIKSVYKLHFNFTMMPSKKEYGRNKNKNKYPQKTYETMRK